MTEMQRLIGALDAHVGNLAGAAHIKGRFLVYALKQYRRGRKAERQAALRALDEFERVWRA